MNFPDNTGNDNFVIYVLITIISTLGTIVSFFFKSIIISNQAKLEKIEKDHADKFLQLQKDQENQSEKFNKSIEKIKDDDRTRWDNFWNHFDEKLTQMEGRIAKRIEGLSNK